MERTLLATIGTVLALLALLTGCGEPPDDGAAILARIDAAPNAPVGGTEPTDVRAFDKPGDDGGAAIVAWKKPDADWSVHLPWREVAALLDQRETELSRAAKQAARTTPVPPGRHLADLLAATRATEAALEETRGALDPIGTPLPPEVSAAIEDHARTARDRLKRAIRTELGRDPGDAVLAKWITRPHAFLEWLPLHGEHPALTRAYERWIGALAVSLALDRAKARWPAVRYEVRIQRTDQASAPVTVASLGPTDGAHASDVPVIFGRSADNPHRLFVEVRPRTHLRAGVSSASVAKATEALAKLAKQVNRLAASMGDRLQPGGPQPAERPEAIRKALSDLQTALVPRVRDEAWADLQPQLAALPPLDTPAEDLLGLDLEKLEAALTGYATTYPDQPETRAATEGAHRAGELKAALDARRKALGERRLLGLGAAKHWEPLDREIVGTLPATTEGLDLDAALDLGIGGAEDRYLAFKQTYKGTREAALADLRVEWIQDLEHAIDDRVANLPFRYELAAGIGTDTSSVEMETIAPANRFKWQQTNNLFCVLVFSGIVLFYISRAKQKDLFLRRIPGLDAIEEAIGRGTEMGRPIYYLTGRNDVDHISTIAATIILGEVAKKVAAYDTPLIIPHTRPMTMAVCQEITKEAYIEAGRPDAFREDANFYITEDQFSYAAAVQGMMERERPAACIYMGYYYAESLLLAEIGADVGAIQVAGTDADSQIPFFVTACDYTLIGEELYAATAYLSRKPVLTGTLRGQDVAKAVMMAAILTGTFLATLGVAAAWPSERVDWVLDLFRNFGG